VTRGPIRLAELADLLERPFEGDGGLVIEGVAALEHAGPGDLAWVGTERWAEVAARSKAGAVIAPGGLDVGARAVIRSPDPRLDFARAVRHVRPAPRPAPGVDPASTVAGDAVVDATAAVAPGCVIGAGARIGAETVLHPNVTVYPGVVIGSGCVLHAGCVVREGSRLGDRVVLQPGATIGGDGFGYARDEAGGWQAVPQIGGVVLEDDVEIGANATVDRGSLGDTIVRRGVKIDDLVLVAHNCDIGENVLIAGQAGIAGSARVGRDAILLSQAGVADHVRIGARAYVAPQSGVAQDVDDDARVAGSPAMDLGVYRRVALSMGRIPELIRRVRRLERGGGGGSAG
jgi:UDP-3-O-[3-hydroxymyristoyl] glucosamine N-acyltransferase